MITEKTLEKLIDAADEIEAATYVDDFGNLHTEEYALKQLAAVVKQVKKSLAKSKKSA